MTPLSPASFDSPFSHVTQVAALFPELNPLASVQELSEGFSSRAYLINRTHVLRVPITAQASESYRLEARILDHLAPHLPCPVPKVAVHDAGGMTYACHPLISGMPYNFSGGKSRRADTLAPVLAQFLAALHRIDRASAPSDIPSFIRPTWVDDDLRVMRPALGHRVLDLIERATQIPDEQLTGGACPVLLHGDLNECNILIRDGKVAGIIDFGSACWGSINCEFAPLIKYDPTMTRHIARHYTQLTGHTPNLARSIDLAVLYAARGLAAEGHAFRTGEIHAISNENHPGRPDTPRTRHYLARLSVLEQAAAQID